MGQAGHAAEDDHDEDHADDGEEPDGDGLVAPAHFISHCPIVHQASTVVKGNGN